MTAEEVHHKALSQFFNNKSQHSVTIEMTTTPEEEIRALGKYWRSEGYKVTRKRDGDLKFVRLSRKSE